MKSTEQKIAFFDNPHNVTWILRVFYAICVLLVLADFIVHRHIYVKFEEIPAFYALYGFVACVVLVVVAKAMRKIVMRDENYYDNREDETCVLTDTPHAEHTNDTQTTDAKDTAEHDKESH